MPSIHVSFNDESVMDQNLTKDVYVIGRHEDCEIHIDNLGISRSHARLLKEGDLYAIEDLKSSNGTYVNGERVEKQVLNDGDQIVIGKYVLTYSAAGQAPVAAGSGAQAAAGGGGAPMPGDVLHTMAMDGDAIRKRIEEMQKKKDTAPLPAVEGEAKPPKAQIAQAELRAREAEMKQLQARMRTTKVIVVLLVLGVLAAVLYFLFVHNG